jgi:hypothetical protein
MKFGYLLDFRNPPGSGFEFVELYAEMLSGPSSARIRAIYCGWIIAVTVPLVSSAASRSIRGNNAAITIGGSSVGVGALC